MRAIGILEFIDRDWPVGKSTFSQELFDINHVIGMIELHIMP